MSHIRFHIVLIGFMGSGKSTIGSLLADRLKMPYVDTDQKIEKKLKMSISEIFKTFGEQHFRQIESEVLQEVLASALPAVISTGGGAPCHLGGMEYILNSSFSFYLKVGRTQLLDRIFNDKKRPLVATKTKKQLKQFIDVSLRKREKYYKKANQVLRAYDHPERIVIRILEYLDRNNL